MLEQNLLDEEWWHFSHRDDPPNDKQKEHLISHFDTTTVRSFIIGFYSVMEHMLRDTLRTIDDQAVNNARGKLSKVYNYFLERMKLKEDEEENYQSLFKIFSHIRNSIHNDGQIFRRWKQGEVIKIHYKGREFIFKDGDKVDLDLDTYIFLSEEMIDFLWILFKDNYVTKGLKNNL